MYFIVWKKPKAEQSDWVLVHGTFIEKYSYAYLYTQIYLLYECFIWNK